MVHFEGRESGREMAKSLVKPVLEKEGKAEANHRRGVSKKENPVTTIFAARLTAPTTVLTAVSAAFPAVSSFLFLGSLSIGKPAPPCTGASRGPRRCSHHSKIRVYHIMSKRSRCFVNFCAAYYFC